MIKIFNLLLMILVFSSMVIAETVESDKYKTTIITSGGGENIESNAYRTNTKIVWAGGISSSDNYRTSVNLLSIPIPKALDTGAGGTGNLACPEGFKLEGVDCVELTPLEVIQETVEEQAPTIIPIVGLLLIICGFLLFLYYRRKDDEGKKKFRERFKLNKKENRGKLKEDIKDEANHWFE